jgi:CBS domain-containing protein
MSFLIKNEMNRHVVTVNPQDSLKKVVDTLSAKDIGCVVVLEKDKPVGILTERDILRRVAAKNVDVKKTKVRQVMTKNLISIEPEKTIQDAADILEKNKIKKLVIVENNRLVGIITMTDVLKSMRKIEGEQSRKMRKICEELQKTKIQLQTKINELERKCTKRL